MLAICLGSGFPTELVQGSLRMPVGGYRDKRGQRPERVPFIQNGA
jgi:hypothetical protein